MAVWFDRTILFGKRLSDGERNVSADLARLVERGQLRERIERLEGENKRLRDENAALRERVETFAAHIVEQQTNALDIDDTSIEIDTIRIDDV